MTQISCHGLNKAGKSITVKTSGNLNKFSHHRGEQP